MNLNNVGAPRAGKLKVYSVDTRKPSSVAELSVFLNPANRFQEIVNEHGLVLRKPRVYRNFFHIDKRTESIPKKDLQTAFKAAEAALAPPPPPPPPVAPAAVLPSSGSSSQGSYASAHEDEAIDEITNYFAQVGVDNEDEFNELAELLEKKASMDGGGRRMSSRRKHRHRIRRRRHTRRRR